MASNNKPIDPAIIIRQCDEALAAAAPLCMWFINSPVYRSDFTPNWKVLLAEWKAGLPDIKKRGVDGTEAEAAARKIRAARNMIKEYENGK